MTTDQIQEENADATQPAPTKRATTRRRTTTSGKKATTAKSSAKESTTAGKARRATSTKKSTGKAASPRKRSRPEPQATEQAAVVSVPRLLTRFRDETAPALMKEFEYSSTMAVPRLSKIVLNIGLGEALENPRAIENATRDLSLISGQHPMTTRARKSIAAFKVREGMALGLSVTLRGKRMYEFLDRLVSSTLPRIRDFRGVSTEAFDGRGNYSLGIREQVIFPEIEYNSIDRIRGLQVVIVTSARTDREGLRLLELLGMPFARAAAAA